MLMNDGPGRGSGRAARVTAGAAATVGATGAVLLTLAALPAGAAGCPPCPARLTGPGVSVAATQVKRQLAFTGAGGLVALLVAGVALLALGTVTVLLTRRSRRRPSRGVAAAVIVLVAALGGATVLLAAARPAAAATACDSCPAANGPPVTVSGVTLTRPTTVTSGGAQVAPGGSTVGATTGPTPPAVTVAATTPAAATRAATTPAATTPAATTPAATTPPATGGATTPPVAVAEVPTALALPLTGLAVVGAAALGLPLAARRRHRA